MLNGNGSLDTQTHRLIQGWVADIPTPTTETMALLEPPPARPITGMHEIQPSGRDD
jgi:hypothetical protein